MEFKFFFFTKFRSYFYLNLGHLSLSVKLDRCFATIIINDADAAKIYFMLRLRNESDLKVSLNEIYKDTDHFKKVLLFK